MADIELYNDLTPVSNEWLRRYQVPTDRVVDRTSLELIKIFVNAIDPNMERLPGLGDEPLAEANKFLTVELKELGVKLGSHPTREIGRVNNVLNFIKSNPYVTYQTKRDGKTIYHEMPLIKMFEISDDGQCKLVFNDALRYFFFPEKDYALCSFSLLKEIRERNVYSAIIYEEACSYENMFKYGKIPYFTWSVNDARKKFSYDRMKDFSEDKTEYVIEEVKKMRPDVIRDKVVSPALAVLEALFIEGKTKFWVDLEEKTQNTGRRGRPTKDFFRFTLSRDKKETKVLSSDEGQQLNIEFDDYVEMDTLYYIKEHLETIGISKPMTDKIIGQLQRNEQKGTHEDVLMTIKTKRSKYDSKPKNERANLILSILGREHNLGDPSKFKLSTKNSDVFWPDDLEGRINAMKQSTEIKDRASRDFGLSSKEVDDLLSGSFRENCINSGRVADDWQNAVNRFFSWIKLLGIKGPINNMNYGNKQRTARNVRGTAAFSFFNEPAEDIKR